MTVQPASRLWSRKVRELTPYVPGEQPRDRTFVKLNTNENPYPPAPGVRSLLRGFAPETLRLYPDPTSLKLRRTIAGYYGLGVEQIFVGNGSDEVLSFAFQAFFNARSEREATLPILFPDVTYSFYPVYARLYDIPYLTPALRPDFSLNTEHYCVPSGGVAIANPNAPTGIALGLEEIEHMVAADPARLVLIDEAYVDFGADSAVTLINRYDNILIVQTLSKSRSLAGMRVGLAMGHPDLIEALQRIRDSINSYTLDTLAQSCACAAFEDGDWFEHNRARLIRTREHCRKALTDLGFEVLPSQANFVFAAHPAHEGADLYRRLREEGVLVRHFKLPRIDRFLRISIGTDTEVETLILALQKILAAAAADSQPGDHAL